MLRNLKMMKELEHVFCEGCELGLLSLKKGGLQGVPKLAI